MDAKTQDAAAGRNIVLTGFMGTGKSTTGRLVAARLGYDFVDTDVLIEGRHGPIPQIFADQGEEAFRTIEHAIAEELADRRRTVIATGGRMLLDPDIAHLLTRHGTVVCLTATVDELVMRVGSDRSRMKRPLLAVDDPRARIEELLAERATGYARFVQVDTTGREHTDVADDVIALSRAVPQ